MRILCLILITGLLSSPLLFSQTSNSTGKEDLKKEQYKKRVLPASELDLISSLYTQEGQNAAVSGGVGSENLQNATSTIMISIPIKEDHIVAISAGVSAYTSASSSNINPFDGGNPADPFVASSGESRSDLWSSANLSYSHYSDDRNKILSVSGNFATEYDYNSVGISTSYSQLFNQKNTEISINAGAFFDHWTLLYPVELSAMGLPSGEDDDEDHFDINKYTLTGNKNYQPIVENLNGRQRNSYAVGLAFSQILTQKMQFALIADISQQRGQLSTPFQRVYFKDFENTFIENFHLADDIERLPSIRNKIAVGSRLNFYLNEGITIRSFYRFYQDSWQLRAQTVNLEVPIKILMGKFVLYPSYRYYTQTASAYFAAYDQHFSNQKYYTSDYDLSAFSAQQFGFGIAYRNILGKGNSILGELKGIDLKYYYYRRNSGFTSHLLTFGIKFTILP